MTRIDRSRLSAAEAIALDDARDRARARRERNLAAGECINQNKAGTHGKATHGVRCKRCAAAHGGYAL